MNAWIGTLQAAKYDAAGLQGNKQLTAVSEADSDDGGGNRLQAETQSLARASSNLDLDEDPDNEDIDIDEDSGPKEDCDGGSASDEKDSYKLANSFEL